ncbi:chemotaxis protein CheW [Lysobacter sp. GX 14042]|uniref:chemotaxis protein CheW n=1 Tax=Lysobacter sp. GX 14042 TaxID=2907155 RepID=UPI001F2C2F9A|nr:chemotaxis protein CheW [Lysobacter sp. GX 14042]MCE7033332.1 chemotaxis protein CheW [Lysobacter sp. GX 14042]
MNHAAVDAYLDELLAPVAQAATTARDAANEPHAGLSAPMPAVALEPAAARVPVPPPIPAPAPAPVHAPAHVAAPVSVPAPACEPAPVAAAPPARWLRARLGRDSYAFQLLRVQEVVRVAPVVAMRGAAGHVLGVMNLRGRIVPVTDLAAWLGTGRVEPDEHSRIIVLEHGDELLGVLVSALDDVTSIAAEGIEQPFTATAPGAVLGIARSMSTPTVLLDATALFQ